MRFLALLRKELREALPWMSLAAVVFLIFGGLVLREKMIYPRSYPVFSPYSNVGTYHLTRYPLLGDTGTLLFLTSIGLGLILGGRQFWVAHYTKTWGFILHRSVSRKTILAAKLAAAAIAFVISLGIIWSVFYWYTSRPELLPVPSRIRIFIEGWVFIVLGFVIYLGTALAGLSRAKWYTIKIFGLGFAVLVLVTTFVQWRLISVFAAIVVGIVILLTQIIDTFLNREF